MDTAEVYLLLVRPTGVPVAGEAVPVPFTGQIELNTWSWNLVNQEEAEKAEAEAKLYSEREAFIKKRGSATVRLRNLQEDFQEAQNELAKQLDKALDKADTEKKRKAAMSNHEEALAKATRTFNNQWGDVLGLVKSEEEKDEDDWKKERAEQRAKEIADLERNKNLEFTFTKRVDVATTQMLNSMKAGDVFPSAVLTIYHRSTNAPLSLVISVEKLRLLDYSLDVEVSDTMSDMRENWRAEFASFKYVYQNKPNTGGSTSAAQVVSQGQTRVFVMNARKLLKKLL